MKINSHQPLSLSVVILETSCSSVIWVITIVRLLAVDGLYFRGASVVAAASRFCFVYLLYLHLRKCPVVSFTCQVNFGNLKSDEGLMCVEARGLWLGIYHS